MSERTRSEKQKDEDLFSSPNHILSLCSRTPEGAWIERQFTEVNRSLFSNVTLKKPRQIKIAVLGTGFGIPHSDKESLRDRLVWRDFVEPHNLDFWKDEDATTLRFGQGTFVVCLLLKLVPQAKIYVCRVARSRETLKDAFRTSTVAQVSFDDMKFLQTSWY